MVISGSNIFAPTLITDVYAENEQDAEVVAIEMAKKRGIIDACIFKIPGWIIDRGLAPKYSYTILVELVYRGEKNTQILKNVEDDTEWGAKAKAREFFSSKLPGCVILDITIGTTKQLW